MANKFSTLVSKFMSQTPTSHGMRLNRIIDTRKMSKYYIHVDMYGKPNTVMDMCGGVFKALSLIRKVRKINSDVPAMNDQAFLFTKTMGNF